ncbi:hypothetical protein GCM10010466_68180 [Planomonospora alba]|uniref:Uncharacterized protein n=1 Tax=Planomonospora alba TaxID=161354 RepID=A0ABP6P5N0_9ACTN
MVILSGLRLARAAAVWGARFHLRHLWAVSALSMVPTVQRFVAVRWGEELPAAAGAGGEALTGAARLLLLYVIVRLAVADGRAAGEHEAGAGERGSGERGAGEGGLWERLAAGLDRRRGEFAVQFLVLGAAFTVFDILPNLAVAHWVAAQDRELVASVLVSVKNPTVIAFTFVWMVGVARELYLAGRSPVRG